MPDPLSSFMSWSLLKFMSTESVMLSHPPSSSSPFAFSLSQPSGSFPVSQFFASGALSIGASAPPSMEFSRQGYWNGLPFPSPGDLPDPGIEPGSPALQADTLPSEPPGKPKYCMSPLT